MIHNYKKCRYKLSSSKARCKFLVLEHRYCESVMFVSRSWSSYNCCFVSYMRCHILWYTWYPQMTPDAEKGYGTAVAVAVVIAISHYQWCLGHITSVPQLYTSTMTGNDDCPILEPVNLCDATIGNEFLESDTSLEITSLKCYILTQN